MTIIHVSTKQSWRGGEQQIAYLIDELRDAVVEQVVLTPANSKLSDFCQEHGIRKTHFYKWTGINFHAAHVLKKICKRYSQPIIHAHDSHAHTFAYLSSLFFGNKAPIIVSRRVDFPVHRNLFSKWKYNAPQIRKIICVSEKIKEITAPSIHNKTLLTVVYSGIDISRFSAPKTQNILKKYFQIPEHHLIIGNIAALAPHKDYFTFVDTAELILKQYQDVTFLIIGQGPMKQRIAEYIFDKKLQNSIYFTGYRTDIPEILPELDIFLMTSETEGLGTSLLDAFASEVPVVATRAGGIPEIVKHNYTGLLADVKDPVQLAEYVLTLIRDPELKSALVKNAKQEMRTFTKQQTARKTLEIYQQVILESY
ncbi:MAG TPA: glycosyltransferase family 4 protein [Bacteroidales bacterium]|nr:glycosyltransferase family 4 protein [Bacteroidales bacterium]